MNNFGMFMLGVSFSTVAAILIMSFIQPETPQPRLRAVTCQENVQILSNDRGEFVVVKVR